MDFSKFRQKLSQLYRYCLATYSYSRKFCASEFSLASTSWLRRYCLTREKRVFSVLYSKCDSFQTLKLSLALTLFEPHSTQITISFKPHPFQAKFLQNPLKVCVSNTFFIIFFRIMQNLCLGFYKLGIFENWVGFLFFVKFFSILWLGWVPFGVCAFVLAPCGNLNLYWGIFHHVHAFFYCFYTLLHGRCSTKCPSNILWLYWTQMSFFTWVFFVWTCFTCFGCV